MTTKKGDWVTNFPRSLKGYWPRRQAEYYEGDPKPSDEYTVEDLKARKLVGIYLNEDIPEGLHTRELIKP